MSVHRDKIEKYSGTISAPDFKVPRIDTPADILFHDAVQVKLLMVNKKKGTARLAIKNGHATEYHTLKLGEIISATTSFLVTSW